MHKSLPLLIALALMAPHLAMSQSEKKTNLLSSKDSLLLTVESGNKLIHHLVRPKETLFAVARYYGLSLEELYELHPEFQNDPVLKIGTLISIPIPNRAITRYKGKNFKASQFVPIYYVVQSGDNLFNIAKRYFNMPVDSVIKRNNLKSENIKPGQLLHMGWMGVEGIRAEWRTGTSPTSGSTHRQRYEEGKKSRKEVVSQGVCFWQHESNEKGDLYALHREAAIGTVMAVTNPMSRKTVYAKVIGRIPSGYESNIEVVLSPAAARQIGARDPRFFVKVRFLK